MTLGALLLRHPSHHRKNLALRLVLVVFSIEFFRRHHRSTGHDGEVADPA